MTPPPTPTIMPSLPVDVGHGRPPPSVRGWLAGCAAVVLAMVAIFVYGITREPPRCIGWEPAPPVYRLKPDGYHPEPRWRCIEWEGQ